MKKMIFLFAGVAMILYGVSLLPSASAFMVHETETYSNQLVPAVVETQVIEDFDKTNSVKNSIVIKNTGTVDVYVRVHLVGYWQDTKGYPVGINFVMPAISNASDWLPSSEPYTYYYTKVVRADETENFTSNLLSSSISMTKTVATYNGVTYEYYPVIEVFAEAIQAEGTSDTGGTLAVVDAWGVTVVDKKITAVP